MSCPEGFFVINHIFKEKLATTFKAQLLYLTTFGSKVFKSRSAL